MSRTIGYFKNSIIGISAVISSGSTDEYEIAIFDKSYVPDPDLPDYATDNTDIVYNGKGKVAHGMVVSLYHVMKQAAVDGKDYASIIEAGLQFRDEE